MQKPTLCWSIILILIAALLVVFLYYPVIFIVKQAFFPVRYFSVGLLVLLFKQSVLVQSMLNSSALGILVTVFCLLVSLPLAWITSRYKIRGQGIIAGCMLLPMVLPPFVGAIGMKLFLSRFGTLNLFLMSIGVIREPLDFMGSGFWGVAILETLHLFPIVYLNLSAALSNIDPSLEEAAWNLGSRRLFFVRKILMPLASPGLFAGCAIVFIWSLTDLGTPLILEYRPVVAYQIYTMLNDIYENPMGYALVVVMVTWIALVYFTAGRFFLRRSTVMSMRAGRTVSRPLLSPTKQILAWGLFAVVLGIAVMPHLMIMLSSIADKWFITMLPEKYTLKFYGMAVVHPLTMRSIRLSVFLSAITTLVDIGFGVAAAYAIRRFRFFGRQILDFSIMLPLALPGLILAFGYVGTFAGTPLDPRNNPVPLLIAAYAVRRLPFMVRSLDAGLRQVHPSMEEAALNLGATPFKALMRITMPLVTSNIIAGGILVFAFSMLEVSDSLILAMKEYYYPLTKAIFALVSRIADGFPLASALGVIAMLLMGGGMIMAGKILGRKMGELFRM